MRSMSENSNVDPRQHFTPTLGYEHVVLDTHATDAWYVRPLLDRKYHTRFDHRIHHPRRRPGDARLFVHFKAEPVARPMAERISQAMSVQHPERGRVDLACGHARPHRLDCGLLGFGDRPVQPGQRLAWSAKLNRTSKIHAVSVVDASEVQHRG